MRPLALRIRWGLRGPLLILILMLISVIGLELMLLGDLGRRVAEGQYVLRHATAEQIEALEMEINAREQDMALFRYLRTGDEIYLTQLADRWIELNQMLIQHRRHVDENSVDQRVADDLLEHMAEAESLAGVLIMLRQHQATNLSALQSRVQEADTQLADTRSVAGASESAWEALLEELEIELDGTLLAVSSYVALPRDELRVHLERSLGTLREEIAALAELRARHPETSWADPLSETLGHVERLVRQIIATQDDQAHQFEVYASTLKTLSEEGLGRGLRVPTALRQQQAQSTLRATVDRTVLHGLLLGGIAAFVALLGGLWFYRHAVSAHEYAQMFQALIDRAPQGVFLHSAQGVVTYANPAALALLGVDEPRHIIGRPNLLLTQERIIEPLNHLFERVREGETVHHEISLDLATLPLGTSRSGQVHFLATLFPTADPRSAQPMVVQVLTDITERMRAVEARAAAEREMEEQRSLTIRADRLRSLGEMAAGIAHELNQPLVGVRGLAEHMLLGLERGWAVDEKVVREKAGLIIQQADRMEHIIEHVRMFAREAGKTQMQEVDVNGVVRSSIDLLGTQLRNHGIQIVTDLCDNLPSVHANPFSLEEVIINLILNARDGLQDGGAERIAETPPHLTLSTGLSSNGGERRQVIVRVEDNGTGIPPEILDKIFNPFFTTKGPQRGTGLGLSIAKAIMEDFGGDLEIRSTVGTGTVATVLMPQSNGNGEA